MGRVNISREAEKKIHEELKYLKEIKRPQVLISLQEARRKGDLSENGEYDAAKEEQRIIQNKINHLEVMIRNVSIIDDQNISSDKVYIGARVDLHDIDSDEDVYYILVHEVEADFKNRKISTSSPIGKTLLGKSVDDVVEITVPKGTLRYRILKISR